MIDQTLGHYRVLEKVGAGGMGIVYRARDEHLEREVALKVLPAGLLADENARRRFKKEALALSKLNHPNVEAVYDFNSQDGVDFLVMEYVEGVTLTQKLASGPLPEAQVTALGAQIAQALEEAHGKGIIHRDLKPGNIMVTPKGQVKVLDFGLATLLHQPVDTAALQNFGVAETAAAGTLPYVAPEQLRGTRADPRSDLYAAGAVLYEMATAHRLFKETESLLLITAILHQAPATPAALNASVSPDLARIIEKALEKDPQRRYQSAVELRLDLERLGVPPPVVVTSHRIRARWWALLVASTLTGAYGAFLFARHWMAGSEPAEFTVTRLLTTPTEDSESRISPDGEWVSILSNRAAGEGTIALLRPGKGEPREVHRLPGHLLSHVWSPRGDELAVLSYSTKGTFLQIVPAQGGPPRRSVALDVAFRDASLVRWIKSDIYFDVRRTGLWRVSDLDFEPRRVMPGGISEGERNQFDICQDGMAIAFNVGRGKEESLWISQLREDRPRRLSPKGFRAGRARWLGPSCDRLAFISGRGGETDLWQVAVDDPRPYRITASGGVKRLGDTSPDGTRMTFEENHDRANLWLMEPGVPSVRRWQITTESLLDFWPSAANGTGFLAFQRSVPTEWGNSEIFGGRILLAQLGGNVLKNPQGVVDEGGCAKISPGGEFLAYVRGQPPRRLEAWVRDLHSGRAWRVASHFRIPRVYPVPLDWVEQNLVWSGNGRALYLVAEEEGGRQEILRVDPAPQAAPPEVLVAGKGNEAFSDLYPSPDDALLSYVRSDGLVPSVSELRWVDLAARESRRLVSYNHGTMGDLIARGWIDDGRSLLVLRAAINPDWSEHLQVIRVGLTGLQTRLGIVDRAYGGTARLDATGSLLYLTKADGETGAHNLYEFRLADGRLRPLTDNKSPRTSFSGLQVLSDGKIVYSEQERDSEVRLISFHR